MQLPNWMEAAATFWASALLGAVTVPIVHFYGPKELGFILEDSGPQVFITAAQFGRMTYTPETSSHVPIVGVVGHDFDVLLADEPLHGVVEVDAAAPALIAYTSGTTRNPKGVIHTHQTLICETRQLMSNYEPDRGRQLTALPVGHFIGMLGAVLFPVLDAIPADMCDEWNPTRVISLMDSDASRSVVAHRISSPACSTIPISDPIICVSSARSASADPPCRPPFRAAWTISVSSSHARTGAPNTPPSPDPPPPHRKTSGFSPTAAHGRASRSA